MKSLRITIEGKTYDVDVEILGEEATETRPARAPAAARAEPAQRAAAPAPAAAPKPAAAPAGAGQVPSPLSGTVVTIDVAVGQVVAEGDRLVTLEAMKMHTIISAPGAGTVSAILVQPGNSVAEGQALVSLS